MAGSVSSNSRQIQAATPLLLATTQYQEATEEQRQRTSAEVGSISGACLAVKVPKLEVGTQVGVHAPAGQVRGRHNVPVDTAPSPV